MFPGLAFCRTAVCGCISLPVLKRTSAALLVALSGVSTAWADEDCEILDHHPFMVAGKHIAYLPRDVAVPATHDGGDTYKADAPLSGWQGLFCQGERCELRAATVETGDSGYDSTDDTSYAFAQGRPLLVFQGLGLAPGPKPTWFIEPVPAEEGRRLHATHPGKGKLLPQPGSSTLGVLIPGADGKKWQWFPKYNVKKQLLTFYLSDGVQQQAVTATRPTQCTGARRGNVLWAGDLDGDGKLDLVFLFPSETGCEERLGLYLSTRALAGRFVGTALEETDAEPCE